MLAAAERLKAGGKTGLSARAAVQLEGKGPTLRGAGSQVLAAAADVKGGDGAAVRLELPPHDDLPLLGLLPAQDVPLPRRVDSRVEAGGAVVRKADPVERASLQLCMTEMQMGLSPTSGYPQG